MVFDCTGGLLGAAARRAAGVALLTAGAAGVASADELAPPQQEAHWEGAIGPVLRDTPEYEGGSRHKLSVLPGFFLRYGRFTVSNTGAFVTRRRDDVFQGLGADLKLADTVRTNLALRVENGRHSDASSALTGLNDRPTTVRARLSLTWTPPREHPLEGWRTTLALGSDLLGRGGGNVLDLGTGHDFRWSPRLVFTPGVGVSAADATAMRRFFGVEPDEAARTGYAVYTPGAGLRGVNASAGWRMEIDPQWVAFWSLSAGRLLGPAKASPLTFQPNHWEAVGGIARRF